VTSGFTPIPPHKWTLDRRASALGFPGLRAYLDARYTHAARQGPAFSRNVRFIHRLFRA
jgi:hypothetical protein